MSFRTPSDVRFPLLTARLALRPFALTDVAVMHRIYGDADVMRYVGSGPVSDIAVTESMLAGYIAHQETHGFSVWALVDRASDEVIGDAGLQVLAGGPEVELGYTLGSGWWGRGYATEAGRACVAAAFRNAGLKLLVALTDPANAASVRILQKLGFEYREARHAYGRQHDLYALICRLPCEPPTAAAIEDGGLRAGATVGGYSLESELGRGGMGVVYQAWDNQLQRPVALKVIAPSHDRDPTFRERFRRESRLMATIEHPNVVPVYRAGQDRGRLYVAMRLVDGTDLREILVARGKLDPDLAVRMTGQIAAALDAAHDRGLLHRDVKPANILVNGPPGQEHAFLTDFGIAKLAAREGLTKTGEVIGTLDYLAPEVLRGEPVDRRADVYALGCVLFELFTGTVPYPRDSDAGRIAAHLHETPPTVSQRGANVRSSLDAVVRRALAKHPAQRFSSPGDLARATLQALEEPSGRRSTRADQAGGTAALRRTSAPGRSDLRPAEAPLIGREREIEELARLCTATHGRVLTIVGPGGSGKTSLAVATADALLDRFEDGVFIVALEGVGDPDAVPGAVARRLGLPQGGSPSPLAALIAHLHERRVLLLLDNFEHLMGAAAAVGEIAAGAPRSRLLVTSQAPLKLRAEHVFALRGLTLPPSDVTDVAVLSRFPSVALLIERTREVDADFSLAADSSAAVRELCTMLDGIPLAIELAAARLALVTPAQLLDRVERGIDALGHGARDLPSRQRGLRAMLDWTCSLLSAAERNLLMRLAVFVGGFTLELAETMSDDEVLEALAALRDVSLVHRGSNGRLSMPPPVRVYALESLSASGGEHAARRRHAEALLALTEPRSATWFRAAEDLMLTLEPEADNLRAAMSWTRSHDIALHGRLAVSTALWLAFRGGHAATTEIDAALRNAHGRRLEAELLLAHTVVTSPFGELAVADRAVDAWRELGDHTQLTIVLANRAVTRAHHGQASAALMDAREARELAESVGDEYLRDVADLDYGNTLLLAGCTADAIAVLGPLVERARPGSFVALGAAASIHADAALAEGRNELALVGYGRALAQMRPISTPANVAFQVEGIAMALAGLNRPEEAIKAMALAKKLRREFSCAAPPDWLVDVETALHPVQAALSTEQIGRYRTEVESADSERSLAWITSLTGATDG